MDQMDGFVLMVVYRSRVKLGSSNELDIEEYEEEVK